MSWWKEKPIRLIQTNIREIDMLDLPIEKIIADLKSFHANTLVFNTAGVVANYETEKEYHFKNLYMNKRTVKELVEACHREGIHVICRADFSRVRRSIWEKHREWAYISPEGTINDSYGDINVCFHSKYQQEYAFDIMHEMIDMLDPDGIFLNNTGYMSAFDYKKGMMGTCKCENCRRDYRMMFGEELPEEGKFDQKSLDQYQRMQKRMLAKYREKIGALKALKPDICISMYDVEHYEASTHLHEPFKNTPYMAAEGIRAAMNSAGNKLIRMASVDFVWLHFRHVGVSPWLQAQRVLECTASAGGLDYYVIGRLDTQMDRSAQEMVKQVFAYHAANEEAYQNAKLDAEILVLQPIIRLEEAIQSKTLGRRGEYHGWINFLTENHYTYDCARPDALGEIELQKYKAVILPDLPQMTNRQLMILNEYAKRGGVLIATGRSGIDEKTGEVQLESLAVKNILSREMELCSAYFEIDREQGFPHFENRSLTMVSILMLHGELYKDILRIGRYVPQHRYAPAESCYYTEVTEEPAAAIRRYGKGKTVWMSWLPGREHFEAPYCLATDEFLRDLMENTLNLYPICDGCSSAVEVSILEQANGDLLLHFINTSGGYRKPITMQKAQIGIRLKNKPSELENLVSGEKHDFLWKDGKVIFTLPELEQFQCVRAVFPKQGAGNS